MGATTVSNETIGAVVSPESVVAVKMLVEPLGRRSLTLAVPALVFTPWTDCPRAPPTTSATPASSSTCYGPRGPKGTLDAIQITPPRL